MNKPLGVAQIGGDPHDRRHEKEQLQHRADDRRNVAKPRAEDAEDEQEPNKERNEYGVAGNGQENRG